MKSCFLTLILATLTLAGPLRDAVGQLADLQATGQVVSHSQRNAGYYVTSTSYVNLPGLKGAITLPKGGDLQVTVSIEGGIQQGSNPAFYVRMLVDGNPVGAVPTKIFAGTAGTRSTTASFLAPGLNAGAHVVQMQGSVSNGARAWVNRRTLVMRFAAAASPDLRLYEKSGTSASRQAGGYVDMPGMTLYVNVPWKSTVLVTVQGEFFSYASQKRVFVRALVDGRVTGPDAIVASGASEGTRAFTFTTTGVAAGTRQIRLQWQADHTTSVLFPKVAVTAINETRQAHASVTSVVAPSGQFVGTSSPTYVNVPSSAGTIFVPTRSDVTLRFSAEHQALGASSCLVRPLFDGTPAAPSEVFFSPASSPNQIQSREAVFVIRNVERGWHSFAMQYGREASRSGTVYLGDRTVIATAIRGQRPLLFTALESDRPANYKYGGKWSNAVVGLKNNQRVFRPFVRDNMFRASRSVTGWFIENSKNNLALVEAAMIGPKLKSMREDIYRQQSSPFTKMKHEALRNADAALDYALYDRNGDGKVTKDELYAVVVMYQDSSFGEVRAIPAIPTNDGVTLDYTGGVATVYAPDFRGNVELGLFAHELSHLLIGAGDMYENDPTAPGPYSNMDDHWYFSHLDPVHKTYAGKWFPEIQVNKDAWVTIQPQSQGGLIYKLADPSSHPGEYFLVENRRKTGYDAYLPSEGLALWHVDANKLPNYRTAVAMVPANGPNNKYATYLFTGDRPRIDGKNDVHDGSAVRDTRWFDNTKSGIGVWAIERLANGDMRCFLDVPGDGVFLQSEWRNANLGVNGYVDVPFRVVNTGQSANIFKVTAKFPGALTWTSQSFSLGAGRQKNLVIRATPSGLGQRHALTLEVESTLRPSIRDTQTVTVQRKLRATGTSAPGGTVTLRLQNDTERGKLFAMRASLGFAPGINIPGKGVLPLQADALFFAVPLLPAVFQNFVARLDGNGLGTSRIDIPNEPKLRGVQFYCAYVTFDTAIRDISNGIRVTIN